MDVSELHKLIDDWAAKQPIVTVTTPVEEAPEAKRELPKDKRVVRTKSQGDRVFLLDETKKTRHWITKPEILDSQGFTMADVVEIGDTELAQYQMAAPLHNA